MNTTPRIHPHDVGLPAPVIRKRRHARRFARWMLTIAGLTALAGWLLFGFSVFSAIRIQQQSPYQTIIAWVLLIISSTTLVLGLWYLLLAQVHRVARMVEQDETPPDISSLRCGNCGWPHDGPDRFCRHCGKPLAAAGPTSPSA